MAEGGDRQEGSATFGGDGSSTTGKSGSELLPFTDCILTRKKDAKTSLSEDEMKKKNNKREMKRKL